MTSVRFSGSIPSSATQKRGSRSGYRLGGLGAGGIDRIVAIPYDRRDISPAAVEQAIVAPVNPDGSFDLVLPTGQGDYVILLEDTTAIAPPDRVRAYVTLDQVADTLVALPVSSATGDVALGELAEVGDEAVAEVPPQVQEERFALTQSVLAQRARTDDAFRNVVNAWLNFDPATGRFYSVVPTVEWFASYESFLAGTTDPAAYSYFGYKLAITTNDPRLDRTKLCNGTQTITLRPPSNVRFANGVERGPGNPITGADLVPRSGGWCGGSIVQVGPANAESGGTASLAFGWGSLRDPTFFVDVLQGIWSLEIDGLPVAYFDLSIGDPLDEMGRPNVAMPVLSPRLDASQNLTGLDVAWVLFDPATQSYEPAEVAALDTLFTKSVAQVGGVSVAAESRFADLEVPPTPRAATTATVPPTSVWHTGTTATAAPGAETLGQVAFDWFVGGLTYELYTYRFCVNYDGDGVTSCEGDPDDLVTIVSHCTLGKAAEAPIDVGGTPHQAIQASYYGDFQVDALCLYAYGARPYVRAVHELRDSSGMIVGTSEGALAAFGGRVAMSGRGPGDYTLTSTAYDGVGVARDVVTTHLRVLPFSQRWATPTVTATLSGGAIDVTFDVAYASPIAYDPALVCEHLLAAATLGQARDEGCEASLGADTSCRFCGNACTASQSCVVQGCVENVNPTCAYGSADCDSNGTTGPNGCETDVTTSAANCGACGHACGSGRVCRDATCVAVCPANLGDCDSNGATGPDGCETDLTTTSTSCGACGRVCPALSNCTDGICVPSASSCAAGLADCDMNPATGPSGCETDLYASDAHCGACGAACPSGQACRGGACAARCVGRYDDCDSSVATSPATSSVTCTYVDVSHYRLTWEAVPVPFRIGDRFVTRAGTIQWECSTIPDLANYTYGPVPCPEVLPSLSTRIVAP